MLCRPCSSLLLPSGPPHSSRHRTRSRPAASARTIPKRNSSSAESPCRRSRSTSRAAADRHAQRRHARGVLARLSGVARLRRPDAQGRRATSRRSRSSTIPIWSEIAAAGAEHGLADAEDLPPRHRADSDQPTADFITMANSPTVALTNAPVFPVGGIVDPPTGGSASGCAGRRLRRRQGQGRARPARHVRVRRQVALAQAAGATGVIIYNEGNTPARQNPIFVDNQPDPPATIAAVISSYALGNELYRPTSRARTRPSTSRSTAVHRPLPAAGDRRDARAATRTTSSSSARTSTRCPQGPGINDDGSGTATLLAQAQELADGHYNLATRSASPGGAREEEGLSARPTTRTT